MILDLEAQTGRAVVNVGNVALAADSSQDTGSDGGEVVVGEGDVGLSSLGVLVLTAGGLQVELDDSELEHQVEDNESGDAQRDDHPGIVSSGQAGGEDQVGSTGGEAEACAEAGVVGDDGEDAVQGSIDNIQGEAEEHEAELERLGNAADEGADSSGNNQADSSLLVLGSLDHSQSSTGDTEHHAGEEAGHVHAEVPINTILTGDIASPEVLQITQTNGVKPEHVVQGVMQTGGDQQTVQESVDAGADAAHLGNAVAESNQNAEDDGPDEQQSDRNQNGNDSGHDSNAALAAEECQPVRQLGILELVVAGSTDDGGQDADEGVAGDLAESNVIDGAFLQRADSADNAGAEQLLHHQEADKTCQTCGTVMVIRQTDGSADGEQPSHVVDQGTAGLDQQETYGVSGTGGRAFGTHNSGSQSVTNAHQDTTDGQSSYGKH